MSASSPSSAIAENIFRVRERIADACVRAGRSPSEVTLIAVSKTWPAEAVIEAVRGGITDVGENRVQEAVTKVDEVARALAGGTLNAPAWHLIGHLQTNKVRDAVRTFSVIHSVDSERLLGAIDGAAVSPVRVMLEVNVSGEESKFGIRPAELPELLECARSLQNIEVTGLMTVAPRFEAAEMARPVFRTLAGLAREHALPQLSMGMTEDFEIAIEEGATHVRVGRAIFGERS